MNFTVLEIAEIVKALHARTEWLEEENLEGFEYCKSAWIKMSDLQIEISSDKSSYTNVTGEKHE